MTGYGRLGPYELRGELGRGAMARVWRAWDPGLRREVAIKEPLFDARLSQQTLDEMGRRFVTEGRAAARLRHPNIVDVYAIDVWDGRPAIVMELVEGVTLTDLLSRGPLARGEALILLDQLLDAVGFAHDRGVIHRDIKPDNIFVTPEGVVKLADFGIAHIEGPEVTRLTVAGSVLGTPGYMSPEQAVGRPIDARSDLFSIGVVAYEMLVGENPFAMGSPDATTLIYRIVHEPAPDLQPRLTADASPMAEAIMAALAKDPDERPASALELKERLHGGSLPPRDEPTLVTRMVQPEPVTDAAAGDAQGHGPDEKRRSSSWLPYVIVAAVCTVALVVAFLSASGGGGGGGGTRSVASDQGEAEEEPTTQQDEDDTSEPSSSEGDQEETADESDASTPFVENPPYTLTVDDDGCLALYDGSGERIDDAYLDGRRSSPMEVDKLPEKAIALLEQGLSYDTYDEACKEFTTTYDDAFPPVSPWSPLEMHPDRVEDEGPYWCIVVGVYATDEEAERVAAASTEEFGVDVSVMPSSEWYGLFYEYNHAEYLDGAYCVVTGLSKTYEEVLEKYLQLSEVLGQQLDPQVMDALKDSDDKINLLDELSEIKYAGTRRYPKK